MCGIFGVVGSVDAALAIVGGLTRLEYRGYDSAGLAVLSPEGLDVRHAVGCVANLAALSQPSGAVGIGHTRWATHGAPELRNAHPHRDCAGRIAVAHNGIIENHRELREKLEANGHVFTSETDTEVLAHLIEERFDGDLLAAVRSAVGLVEGSYALAVVSAEAPGRVVAARYRSPLLVGLGEGQMFLASDANALLPLTRRVVFLGERDTAELTAEGVRIFDGGGVETKPEVSEIEGSEGSLGKEGFDHHMLKEIYDIPKALRALLHGRVGLLGERFDMEGTLQEEELRAARRILVIACGTSYYAGVVGKSIVEGLSGVPVETFLASEFRYAPYLAEEGTIAIFVSQSGETADTVEALRMAKGGGCRTLAVVNVKGSTLAREAHGAFYLKAGAEVGVASTKAFVNMVGSFYLLAIHLAQARGRLSPTEAQALVANLVDLPALASRTLERAEEIRSTGEAFFRGADDAFFLGRQLTHGLALEGALKLKEISYVHAEGYAAGELKHGPLALLAEGLPVTALLSPQDTTHAVMLSNIQEVKARGAKVLGILSETDASAAMIVDCAVRLPATASLWYPIPASIALYLLAYEAARARGCPIDRPRNLAKSVTVE